MCSSDLPKLRQPHRTGQKEMRPRKARAAAAFIHKKAKKKTADYVGGLFLPAGAFPPELELET